MGSGNQKMSILAFAGGVTCAVIVDIIGILIPIIGAIFIGFMRVTFWLAGYDMRGTAMITSINAMLEMLPVVPSCTIFMISAFVKNRKNVKKSRT